MDWAQQNVEQLNSIASLSPLATYPGGAVFVPSTYPNGLFDMRGFTSYLLKVIAQSSNAVVTKYNALRVATGFSSATGSLSIRMYEDSYDFIADSAGNATFPTQGGALYIQDNVHGPFMAVRFDVPAGALDPSIQYSYQLFGSTRSFNGTYAKEVSPAGILGGGDDISTWVIPPTFGGNKTIGATSTITLPGLMRYGQCNLRISAGAAYSYNIFPCSLPVAQWTVDRALDSGSGVAGTLQKVLTLPKSSCILQLTNSSAGAALFGVNIVSSLDKF